MHEKLLIGLNTCRLKQVFEYSDDTVLYSSDYSHMRRSKLVITSKWLPKCPKQAKITFALSIFVFDFINMHSNPDVMLQDVCMDALDYSQEESNTFSVFFFLPEGVF